MARGRRLILAFALAVLLLSPAPSRAGSVSYADPPGDATAIAGLNTSRPSDSELDLLDVSWETTADELVVTTSLATLAEPVASDGWAIAHYFDYEDIRFELLIQDVGTVTATAIGSDGVYLRVAGDSRFEYPCVCRFTTKPDESRVTVTAELHSIGSAARAVDLRNSRPSAGSTFDRLQTTSYRVAGVLLAADEAFAPEESNLVV